MARSHVRKALQTVAGIRTLGMIDAEKESKGNNIMFSIVAKRISPCCDRYGNPETGQIVDVLSVGDRTWISVDGRLRPFLSRSMAIQAVEMELGL